MTVVWFLYNTLLRHHSVVHQVMSNPVVPCRHAAPVMLPFLIKSTCCEACYDSSVVTVSGTCPPKVILSGGCPHWMKFRSEQHMYRAKPKCFALNETSSLKTASHTLKSRDGMSDSERELSRPKQRKVCVKLFIGPAAAAAVAQRPCSRVPPWHLDDRVPPLLHFHFRTTTPEIKKFLIRKLPLSSPSHSLLRPLPSPTHCSHFKSSVY